MKKIYLPRLVKLLDRSFFIFGPRGVGKSTWLRDVQPEAYFFELLDHSLYLELSKPPRHLEAFAENLPENSWVVFDEFQKLPELLDEVHHVKKPFIHPDSILQTMFTISDVSIWKNYIFV